MMMSRKHVTTSLQFLILLAYVDAFLTAHKGAPRTEILRLQATKTSLRKVVVVGGGWAGFTAADAIATSKDPVEVVLLDASPRGPGGLAGGWRTPKLKRPVEAGLHGFWREYRNTYATIERIGLSLDDVLTPYTPSILVSKSGRVAVAPVLGVEDAAKAGNSDSVSIAPSDLMDQSALLEKVAEFLPPPLDVALQSEFDTSNPLTVIDRISAIGLLGAWADFEQEDPKSWKKYDKISADNLFRAAAGISPRLYEELVSPLLHVLPMTPGYDCSAAAALSCFHVFALQSKGAFDVRWCRGTISEKIFNPWAEKLTSCGRVEIRGSAKVTAIEEFDGKREGCFKITINDEDSIDCDAFVLAVGGTALKRLLPSAPPLAKLPNADGWQRFRGVTCVAVRLFLRPESKKGDSFSPVVSSIARAMKESPVVVCGPSIGGIPELAETGFCIYDLQRLQDEFNLKENSDSFALEVDFFRADDLAAIEDDSEVARLALRAVEKALGIDELIHPESSIIDMSVVRARDAVSHFCVNSESWSPGVRLRKGMYICGDWIDRSGHASWSTEKAVVTARQAAAALAYDHNLYCETEVIPAAKDTPQLTALRQIARSLRSLLPFDIIPPAPWVIFRVTSRGK